MIPAGNSKHTHPDMLLPFAHRELHIEVNKTGQIVDWHWHAGYQLDLRQIEACNLLEAAIREIHEKMHTRLAQP